MITRRRSDRARQASFARAMPRSACTLRSWNSSRMMVRKSVEQRILLQARREDALGREEHRGFGPNCRSKRTCHPTSPADRPALLGGDARRQTPRRDATRLENNHRPVDGERRRNAGRLPCAWRGGDDDRARRRGLSPGSQEYERLSEVERPPHEDLCTRSRIRFVYVSDRGYSRIAIVAIAHSGTRISRIPQRDADLADLAGLSSNETRNSAMSRSDGPGSQRNLRRSA